MARAETRAETRVETRAETRQRYHSTCIFSKGAGVVMISVLPQCRPPPLKLTDPRALRIGQSKDKGGDKGGDKAKQFLPRMK